MKYHSTLYDYEKRSGIPITTNQGRMTVIMNNEGNDYVKKSSVQPQHQLQLQTQLQTQPSEKSSKETKQPTQQRQRFPIPSEYLPFAKNTTFSSPTHSLFNDVCADYTAYLKTVTSDISKPFLVNVDVYQLDRLLTFYLVINTMHLGNYMQEGHFMFTLLFDGKEYDNLNNKKNTDVGYIVIKFEVPVSSPYQEGQLIEFTLKDNQRFHKYDSVKACVRYPNPDPLPLAICAYVSDYNSIDEIRSWIAFYQLQKVSMVILYVSTPMPYLATEFAHLISIGFLRLIDFTWPRQIKGYHIQCSNQQAQMNSCFYHFKYEVQALIICDVDEYVYSITYPSDLVAMKSHFDQVIPNNRSVIHVRINNNNILL